MTQDFGLTFFGIPRWNRLSCVPFILCPLWLWLLVSSWLLGWKLANLTVPHWHQLKLQLLEVPSAVILLNAWHSKSSILFQFQTSISNHLEAIFVIGQYLVDSSVVACCLQFGIFLCPFCNLLFLLFLGQVHPSFRPFNCLVWWSFGFS